MRIARFRRLAVIVGAVLGLSFLAAGAAAAYPAGQAGTAAINSGVFGPGDTVVVTVQHTTPGALTMNILSATAVIGHGTVAADGSGSVSGTIPAGFADHHTIEVVGAGGEDYRFSIFVTSGNPGISEQVVPGCYSPRDGSPLYGELVVTISSTYPTAQTFRASITPGGAEHSFTVPAGGQASTSFNPLVDGTYTIRTFGVGLGGGSVTTVTSTCGTTTLPSGVTSSPTATVVVTGGTGGTGGTLANTGTQVGLGLGVGLAAVVAGGAVLVASRRRSGRHA